MKNLIFILLLASCASTVCGQIQRRFFDMNLGVTSKKQVFKHFEKQKKSPIHNEDDMCMFDDVVEGDFLWKRVAFSFYDEMLLGVHFVDSVGEDNLYKHMMYALLKSSDRDKKYLSSQMDNSHTVYSDNVTQLHVIEDSLSFILSYTDILLLEKKKSEEHVGKINNTILGMTLGVSDLSSMLEYLEKSNKGFLVLDDEVYYVENVSFAGYTWDFAYFSFYNNKLMSVVFNSSENSPSYFIFLERQFDALKVDLETKYKGNCISSTEDVSVFSDRQTLLYLSKEITDGKYGVTLSYSNRKMLSRKEKDIFEEL